MLSNTLYGDTETIYQLNRCHITDFTLPVSTLPKHTKVRRKISVQCGKNSHLSKDVAIRLTV